MHTQDIPIAWPDKATLTPRVAGTYVDVHGLQEDALRLIDPAEDAPEPLLLHGEQGLGKSLLAATLAVGLAERRGHHVPMITYDCSMDDQKWDFRGSFVGVGGDTVYVPGPLPLAVQMANECGRAVLCLEEINTLKPGAQKELNGLLDWRRGIWVSDVGRMFRTDENCHLIVIGTMNPAGFGGLHVLNPDLRARFSEMRMPYPEETQEARILRRLCPKADRSHIGALCAVAVASRTDAVEYKLSTRDLERCLRNIRRFDGDHVRALRLLLNKYERGDRTLMGDRVDAQFGTSFGSA
jgi:MoxR-like ATPase